MAQAGFDGRLYIGTQGNGATAADEAVDAMDVNINLNMEAIETSSRGVAPWKTYIAGWREWSVDFTLFYENDDTVADALETAFNAGTIISCRLLDEDGDGYYGDCLVTNFSRNEPLTDKMERSVTLQGTGTVTIVNIAS